MPEALQAPSISGLGFKDQEALCVCLLLSVSLTAYCSFKDCLRIPAHMESCGKKENTSPYFPLHEHLRTPGRKGKLQQEQREQKASRWEKLKGKFTAVLDALEAWSEMAEAGEGNMKIRLLEKLHL